MFDRLAKRCFPSNCFDERAESDEGKTYIWDERAKNESEFFRAILNHEKAAKTNGFGGIICQLRSIFLSLRKKRFYEINHVNFSSKLKLKIRLD